MPAVGRFGLIFRIESTVFGIRNFVALNGETRDPHLPATVIRGHPQVECAARERDAPSSGRALGRRGVTRLFAEPLDEHAAKLPLPLSRRLSSQRVQSDEKRNKLPRGGKPSLVDTRQNSVRILASPHEDIQSSHDFPRLSAGKTYPKSLDQSVVGLLNLFFALLDLFLTLLCKTPLPIRYISLESRVLGRALGIRPRAHRALALNNSLLTLRIGDTLQAGRFGGSLLGKLARALRLALLPLGLLPLGFRDAALLRSFRGSLLGFISRRRERIRLLLREIRPGQAAECTEREHENKD